MNIDIKKLALYLVWSLPPYYDGNKKIKFIRQLQKIDNQTYSNGNIDFFDRQAKNNDEQFYFMVLEDFISENNNNNTWRQNIKKLFEWLKLPTELLNDLGVKIINADLVKQWDDLLKELSLIKNKWFVDDSEKFKEAKKFEIWGEKTNKFLFQDSFKEFIYDVQVKTENWLDIRDLIILNNNIETDSIIDSFWWNVIKKDYESKFVTVEFKNYKDKAWQEPIISTLKYLEKPEIWRFWIMITRNWLNDRWVEKQIDLLRWSSSKKSICLLILDDDDIKELINIKMRWEVVESYLLRKYMLLQTKI